jgi:hypothetical protein
VALAGWLLAGSSFGAGVAAAAGLACVDFWLLGRHVRALASAETRPPTLLLGLLSSLRLVLVLAAAWLLLERFPPLSLLVGFASVVAAILLEAAAFVLHGTALAATE